MSKRGSSGGRLTYAYVCTRLYTLTEDEPGEFDVFAVCDSPEAAVYACRTQANEDAGWLDSYDEDTHPPFDIEGHCGDCTVIDFKEMTVQSETGPDPEDEDEDQDGDKDEDQDQDGDEDEDQDGAEEA